MVKIKICGITREEEALWLNENHVEYAGFVLYEKSKRYITYGKIQKIFEKLNKDIRKVAVAVSPNVEQVKDMEQAGFDIIQIHGDVDYEILTQTKLPVWLAINLSGIEEIKRWSAKTFEEIEPQTCRKQLQAILFDAGTYGSGRTFGWESGSQENNQETEWKNNIDRIRRIFLEQKLQFVLAGGLNAANAASGIRLFLPDIVDVSSGVEVIREGTAIKSREKIKNFVQAVRTAATYPT